MNTITFKIYKKIVFILILILSINAYSQVTITRQGFDGLPADDLTYTTSSGTYVTTSNTMSVSSTSSLRFGGANSDINADATFSNIDISIYDNVQVSISFASYRVDNGEDLYIDFSYDNGASFIDSVKLIDGTTGGQGQSLNYGVGDASPGQSSNPYTFAVPSGQNNLMIRVRSLNLDNSEYFYIDNLEINGTFKIATKEINVQGNGNNIASGSTGISVSNNTDFGTTNVLGGTVTKTYSIQNIGGTTLSIWSVYTNSSEFTVTTSSTSIAPGATATLTVVFDPSIGGTRNGIVSISNNDTDESTYSFAVQGIGNGQEINLKANGNNIPAGSTTIATSINTDFGSTSGSKTYTIENLGGDTLNITSVATNSGEFSVTTSSTSIAPGATATLTVTFTMSAPGTRTATVSIYNNDADESTYSFNVQAIIADREINLQGNGINIASGSTGISVSNNTDFGSTVVAGGLVTKTFVIQNTGGFDLSIWSVYTNSGEFTVSTSSTTIIPGGTATLTVVFDPNTSGTRNGIVSISNNDADENTYSFAVQGIGYPLPTNKTVAAASSTICEGSSTNITVANSLSSETYQLRNNSDNSLIGSAVTGTGGTINLSTGNLTSTTTFNVLAKITATGSTAQMTNTPTVTVNPSPIDRTITAAASSVCSGNATTITVASSLANTTYQLRNNVGNVLIGTGVIGNGGTINLSTGNLTSTTTFNVLATITATGCTAQMTNTSTVTVNPLPVNRTISSSASTLCSGNSTNITVASSVNTTKYQLRDDSDNSLIGAAVTGTGGTINLPTGILNSTTTYNVLATINATGCSAQMTTTRTITVNPSPTDKTVSIDDTVLCSGNSTNITIAASIIGETYQLRNNTGNVLIGSAVAGDGGTISLPTGILTTSYTFNVLATNTSSGCSTKLSNTPSVIVNALPVNRTITAPLTVCYNTSANITISSSINTTSYQLRNDLDNSLIGTAVIGTGGTITLPTGNLTNPTTFNVLATINSSGCTYQLTKVFTINIDPTSEGGDVTGGTTICSGSTSGVLTLSGYTGTIVRWESSVSPFTTWSAISNTTTTYTSGSLTQTYQFRVRIQSGACSVAYSTPTTVTVNSTATNKTVGVTSATICNGKETNITVSSSLNTTSYQLRNNSDNSLVGAAVIGTGGTINLPTGNLTSTSTFNVLATLISTGCSSQMSITPTVTVNICNPEIDITGNGISIADGETTPSTIKNTDFGSVSITSETYTVTYTINNSGIGDLLIGAISFTGADASDFAILNPPASFLTPGGSTTFDVIFDPTTIGVKNATINIPTNDADESNYDFSITGTGTFIDTDGDGIPNNIDIDDDNDGILDSTENGTCISDPFMNGSFEITTPILPATSYKITPDANVPGWQSTEGNIEIWSSGFNGVPAAVGNQFAELNANVPGTLYQTFCLNGASGTVKWSIKHRGRSGVDQAFVKFGPTLAAAQASIPIVTMVDDKYAWGTYSGVYTIPYGQKQIVLTFQSGYTASGSPSIGNFIDDVQITITQNSVDTDQDGIVNIVDLDDDNDGIADIEESNFKMYSNNSATMDKTSTSTWMDVNGNGMNDYIDTMIANGTYFIPDTDGDGLPDYIDLDSDNDTLFDVDEAGLYNGDGDVNGDGKGDGIDSDSDGILDLYDNATFFGTNYRVYTQDTDANTIPDFRQLDSNSDGINDIKTGLYGSYDANNDGKIDGSKDLDEDGIIDTFDTDKTNWGSPRDLNRKLYLDFDGRNDYGQDTPTLGGLSSATLMAWIDLNSTFSSTGVVLGQNKFQIRVSSSRKFEAIVNGTTSTFTTKALNKSQWTHVGAVYGNGFLKLFINGEMVKSIALSGNISTDGTSLTIGKNPSANNNYFKGKIDEVRVFDIALSDEQFQRMVYQEVQDNSSQVRGTVIPRDIGDLPFANLIKYYRMDVYKDDIIDNLSTPTTDIGSGMRIYNNKVIDYQQAPLPFVTSQAGDFASAVNNTSRDIRGLDVIDYDYSIIEVKHNITESSNASDIGLVVDPGVTISMINDTKLLNDWYLKLDGKIDLVGKSQLVQTIFSELDATSAGSIERDQQGQSSKFNYNYWSSPVGTMNTTSNNNGYTVASVMKDGTNPNSIKDILWTTGLNGSTTSPITLSSYWIYKFQNTTPIYANWAAVGQNGALQAGQGYTMKGCGAASATQNYTFVGKPNNGTITIPIAADNLNLSGNPYPSAIDATAFITANSASTTGAIYFWEHYSTNNTHVLRDYQGGYASRNLVGGTPPVSPAGISGLGSSTRIPGRYVPVGQGFLVYGSAVGGDIVFDNSQRAFIKEDNANSNVMFRQASKVTSTESSYDNSEDEITEDTFEKIRLGFNSSNNFHRQVLLGFMNEKATSGIDPGYDAPNIDKQPNDMYFVNGSSKLVIQGEGYFNTNSTYPIGVKTNVEGNIKFTLDALENFDSNIEVYIYDKTTDLYHDIRETAFEINLPKGTVEDRFSLRFKNATTALSVSDFDLNKNIIVAFTNDDNFITVKNNQFNTTVESVTLFNMLGQKMGTWDVKNKNQTNIQLPVKNTSTGTYIVKVKTTNGDFSKKIIIQ